MKEFAEIILSVIGLFLLITFLTWMISLPCKTKAKMQNLEYDFGLIQGCMVKQKNGKWIDYNRLRVIE